VPRADVVKLLACSVHAVMDVEPASQPPTHQQLQPKQYSDAADDVRVQPVIHVTALLCSSPPMQLNAAAAACCCLC